MTAKEILKKTKKNHELSLELFATGNSDAMYLAGRRNSLWT